MTPKAQQLRELLMRHVDRVATARENRPPLYDTVCARLGTGTPATKLGISVDTLAPGMRGCPYHFHHAQEEAFVVLEGEGSLRVAGEMLPIAAGDVIFIPPGPEYPHQIVNTSDAPLEYLSISTKETPEIVEYPDSGKVLASAPGVRRMHRAADTLDYWDGEP